MRFDTSMETLSVTRSESVTDLNSELNGLPHHPRRASVGHARNDDSLLNTTPLKPFGIGKSFTYLFIKNKYIIIIYVGSKIITINIKNYYEFKIIFYRTFYCQLNPTAIKFYFSPQK